MLLQSMVLYNKQQHKTTQNYLKLKLSKTKNYQKLWKINFGSFLLGLRLGFWYP